ncbi:hypothetical protein [Pseudobutyrivibrio ruminis]|uniref:hypothetical protein n=1 Tax=Pseudobutyrivibrio ruminis TaxID=46206 RepID=UPI00051C714D|nr:hypothetical protein [Pseudobutyrivibrio ruminis]
MKEKIFNEKNDIILYYIMVGFVFIYGAMYYYIGQNTNMNMLMFVLAFYVVYGVFNRGKIEFDIRFLLLFALYYFGASRDLGFVDYDLKYKTVIPVLVYAFGKEIVGNKKTESDKRIFISMLALAFGMYVQAMLDFSVNLQLEELQTENWNRFWSGTEQARTLFDFEFIFVTSMAFAAIMFWKRYKVLFSIVILLNVVLQIIDVMVEGRFNLFFLMIDICALALVFIFDRWSELSQKIRKTIIGVALGLVAFVAAFFVAFKINLFGLHDMYSNSYLSGSGGIFHNIRFQIFRAAWSEMMKNPDTGYALGVFGTAFNTSHNTYMEFGKEFGLTAFFYIAVYELFVLKDAAMLALNKNKNDLIKYILIASTINCFIYFFMEPSGNRYFFVFMITFFVHGMQRRKCELDKDNCAKTNWAKIREIMQNQYVGE